MTKDGKEKASSKAVEMASSVSPLVGLDGKSGLSTLNGVTIMEQHMRSDVCCTCLHKGEKQYAVLAGKSKVFTMSEHLDLCCRQCSCLCQRDFNVVINSGSANKPLFKLYHPRVCCSWFSCCACCRHRMTVKDMNGSTLGTVGNDCKLCCTCFPEFSVRDHSKKKRYKVAKDANMCAKCLCCGASSRKCCGIRCIVPSTLSIKDAASGKKTNITRTSKVETEDTYNVMFPDGANETDKLLLVVATLMVDYTMYNAPPDKQSMT